MSAITATVQTPYPGKGITITIFAVLLVAMACAIAVLLSVGDPRGVVCVRDGDGLEYHRA